MSLQNSKQISDIKVMLKTGQDGVGINSVTLTNTTGLIDTYTITFDDGRITTFEVTNGSSIQSIEKTGTSGNVDTYTITLTNGNTTTFEVTNGFPATYDSANVTYNNTGTGLSATRVQGALTELDTEKFPKTGGTITGDMSLGKSTGETYLDVGTQDAGRVRIRGQASYTGTLATQYDGKDLTDDQVYLLPNQSGTIALQENNAITASGSAEMRYDAGNMKAGPFGIGSWRVPFDSNAQTMATVISASGTLKPFYLKTTTSLSSGGMNASITIEAIPVDGSAFNPNVAMTVGWLLG